MPKNEKQELSPGLALTAVVGAWPLAEQATFLQHLESKAKREGNLAFLREIKAYRQLAVSRLK